MSRSILNVNGQSVTKSDVLSYLKISGEYQNVRKNVIMNEVLRDYAAQSGIKVSSESLQVYSDLKRIGLGLHSSSDMNNYLNNLGISQEDWEEACETELYREVIKAKYGSTIALFDAWRMIQGLPEIRKNIETAIMNASAKDGLNPSSDELQSASDTYRRIMGLHSAEEFKTILDGLNMTTQDWENHVHSNIAIEKFGLGNFKSLIESEIKSALLKYPVISNLLSDFVFAAIIHTKAQQEGITVSENEVQEYSDNFRRTLGLHNSNVFNIWLSATGFTADEYSHLIETELIKRKFANSGIDLVDNAKIDRLILASASFGRALHQVKVMNAVYSLASQSDFSAGIDDVNNESNYFRRAKGLHSSQDFTNYLDNSMTTLDEWEEFCTKSATIRKLYNRETTNDKILSHLDKNVSLSALVKNNLFSSYVASQAGNFEVKF